MCKVCVLALALVLSPWALAENPEPPPATQPAVTQQTDDVLVYQDDTFGKWHYRMYLQPASSRSRWMIGELSFDGIPIIAKGNSPFMWTPWGRLIYFERGPFMRGWLPHYLETPAPTTEEVPSPDPYISKLVQQRHAALTKAADSLQVVVTHSQKNSGGYLTIVVGDKHVGLPDNLKDAEVKNWHADISKQAMTTIIDRSTTEGFLARAFDPRLARIAAEAPAMAISFNDNENALEVRLEPGKKGIEQLRRVFENVGNEAAQKEINHALDSLSEFAERNVAETLTAAESKPAGILRGRVVHGGQPVTEAQINIYTRGDHQLLGKTKTDVEGRFEAKGLPFAVELEVIASKLRDDSWLLSGSGRTIIHSNAVSKMEDISLGAMPPPVSTPDTPPVAPASQPAR